jgi:hypothetical protein
MSDLLSLAQQYRNNIMPYSDRCREFEERKRDILPKPERCRCCGKPGEHRHHLIQLSRGGDNCPSNLCWLCEDCHATIHPYMKDSYNMAIRLDNQNLEHLTACAAV